MHFIADNLHDNSSQFTGVQKYNTILNTTISKNNHLLDLQKSKFDCRDNHYEEELEKTIVDILSNIILLVLNKQLLFYFNYRSDKTYESLLGSVPIFTKVRRRRLSRKRRRIVKIRSKWYSLRFVDEA